MSTKQHTSQMQQAMQSQMQLMQAQMAMLQEQNKQLKQLAAVAEGNSTGDTQINKNAGTNITGTR